MWYLQLIGFGILQSWFYDHSALQFMAGSWVFYIFTWVGIAFLLGVGNVMATGSWVLRGLGDWP